MNATHRIAPRPVDPDWLALREPADTRARDEAADVTGSLVAHLRGHAAGAGRPLRLVDLGSGTGANVRYLAPRLGAAEGQWWTTVDHDGALSVQAPLPTRPVLADVMDLARVLGAFPGPPDLVTAAALLDLLDTARVTAVVDATVRAGAAALFALNVTGEVRLDPEDDADAWIAQAFDAHQRRDGRLGPDAGVVLAGLLRERGHDVTVAATPWRLDAEEPGLLAEYVAGRAQAAAEWLPEDAVEVRAWLDRRREALASGDLRAVVGHVDVLGLPR